VADCGMIDGAVRSSYYVVQLGVPICRVMDSTICRSRCRIPHSKISTFVAPRGFYAKAYSKVCD